MSAQDGAVDAGQAHKTKSAVSTRCETNARCLPLGSSKWTSDMSAQG